MSKASCTSKPTGVFPLPCDCLISSELSACSNIKNKYACSTGQVKELSVDSFFVICIVWFGFILVYFLGRFLVAKALVSILILTLAKEPLVLLPPPS